MFACCRLTALAQNAGIDQLKKIKNIDSALAYANQLVSAARQKHDAAQEARILYIQSKMAYKTGDFEKALACARQSSKLSAPTDSNTYVQSANMIAYMLSQQGKNVEALNVAFKILRETESHGWKKLNISTLTCIADVYRAIKDIKKALPYALRAAESAKAVQDTGWYIYSLSTLSNLYSDRTVRTRANLVKATNYMEIILAPPYLDFLGSFDKARYLSNLGRLYIEKEDPRAEEVLQQSIAISHAENFSPLEKPALNELVTLYNDKKKYSDAVKYGEKAIAVGGAGAQTNLVLERNIYYQLSKAYKGLNNYNQAFNYFQKATELNDSIMSVDKAKDAAELDEQYRADKRLIIASANTSVAKQQRNLIIVLAIFLVIAAIAIYRWIIYKKRKEALLLAQEHEQLEKLDALKTRFFANISHELRTPLTLIIGPANQLLHKQVETPEQEHNYLRAITRNSKKLLNIVNELLDLGKLEAGKLSLKLKPVALAPFINVVYQSFMSAADYKKIDYKLTCHIDNKLLVQLDQERFEKISNNLIGNAIKFTPGGGAVTVLAAVTGVAIDFSVSNTGMGIHPDDLPYIFDRYYQGRRPHQESEGGTGIGLAIAREFTELMGGTLTIDNTWGEGSTFKINIPFVTAGQLEDTSVMAEQLAFNLPPVSDKPLVMIVEDNPEMAAYVGDILQTTYRLVTAYNGVEALNQLKRMHSLPNLIISDVMMPEMDGFALLEKLKNDESFCTIPVIMLTALADSRNKLKALNIGVDDYVTKPFLVNELTVRVNNLIQNAAARVDASLLDTNEYEPGDEAPASATDDNETDKTGEEITPVSPADLVWLSQLEEVVRQHTGKTNFNLTVLSLTVAISERQLHRRIKNITGLTPNKYIRVIKLQISREAIASGKYRTIAEVAYAAGFETPAYFSKLFKDHYGIDVNTLL
ncbi:MAG: response regulator [Mucilaginibacter sp.]